MMKWCLNWTRAGRTSSCFDVSQKREIIPVQTQFPGSDAGQPHVISRESQRILWEIPLAKGPSAFLCVDRSNYCNDERFVVVVDAAKFFTLWLNSPATDAVPYPKLRHDRKFDKAAERLSRSQSKPVPLANVQGQIDAEGQAIDVGIDDGVTRTMWLLDRCAAAFPVEVHGERQAYALYRAVGVEPPPISVEEMTASLPE